MQKKKTMMMMMVLALRQKVEEMLDQLLFQMKKDPFPFSLSLSSSHHHSVQSCSL